jgi:predicted anti-sigma-YlaC factor YlaD
MKHPSEPELFQHLHLPESGSEIERHLRICAGCAARMAVMGEALRVERARHQARRESRPEGYWTRQREEIRRRIEENERAPRTALGPARWALAGTFVIVLVTGGVFLNDRRAATPLLPSSAPAEATIAPIELPSADPWAADSLEPWGNAVAWESWLEPGDPGSGGA